MGSFTSYKEANQVACSEKCPLEAQYWKTPSEANQIFSLDIRDTGSRHQQVMADVAEQKSNAVAPVAQHEWTDLPVPVGQSPLNTQYS